MCCSGQFRLRALNFGNTAIMCILKCVNIYKQNRSIEGTRNDVG